MVEVEELEDGSYRVSRVFPCASSMQAGAMALERINPEAFRPLPVPKTRNPPAIDTGD